MTTISSISSTPRWFIAFSLLATLIIAVEWSVAHSLTFARKLDLMSLGITLDLVLGIPLAYYFMVIRRARMSRATLLPIVLLSGLAAGIILPVAQHRYLEYWERVMALAEVAVVGLVAVKGRTVVRNFRALQRQMPDFIGNLQRSLMPVLSNAWLVGALVGEVSVFRYSLFGWLGGIEKTGYQRAYTTYRESGQIALMCALLAIILIETAAIHLLVSRSYPGAAWLLTAISLYSLLFLVADTVALVKRPLLIDQSRVLLRLGLRWQGSFPISEVDRVVTVTEAPPKNRATLNGCFLSTPNLLITCCKPIPIAGPFGIKREVQRIALFTDDRDAFIRDLTYPSDSTLPVRG